MAVSCAVGVQITLLTRIGLPWIHPGAGSPLEAGVITKVNAHQVVFRVRINMVALTRGLFSSLSNIYRYYRPTIPSVAVWQLNYTFIHIYTHTFYDTRASEEFLPPSLNKSLFEPSFRVLPHGSFVTGNRICRGFFFCVSFMDSQSQSLSLLHTYVHNYVYYVFAPKFRSLGAFCRRALAQAEKTDDSHARDANRASVAGSWMGCRVQLQWLLDQDEPRPARTPSPSLTTTYLSTDRLMGSG
ncbi:hypothetical protein L249_1637, partial [Ophiocordyceps polyrhachis-furcata BCC 54312]